MHICNDLIFKNLLVFCFSKIKYVFADEALSLKGHSRGMGNKSYILYTAHTGRAVCNFITGHIISDGQLLLKILIAQFGGALSRPPPQQVNGHE